jgi:hypothetical protein
MSNGFGTAKIEREFDGPKYFKLKVPDESKGEEKTELVLRLLPSMKSYRDTGEWKFFYGQHYGHAGVNSRDPSKPRARPFGCIQKKDSKTKEITTHCPKCDQIEAKKKAFETRKVVVLADAGITDDKSREARDACQADKKLKALADWLRRHNCDKKFWMNVMSKAGDFGVFQLSYTTCRDLLEPLLKELRDKAKLDAFDPAKGIYLRFTRAGKAPRVTDNVEVLTETVDVNGEELQRKVYAPLTDAQIERALKVCPDLSNGVVRFLTAEGIQALVDCDDSPEAVDEIWNKYEIKAKKAEPETQKTEKAADEPVDDKPVENKPQAQAAPEPDAEDDEEAELELRMAQLKAKKVAKALKANAAEEPMMKSPAPAADDTDDFLSDFDAGA